MNKTMNLKLEDSCTVRLEAGNLREKVQRHGWAVSDRASRMWLSTRPRSPSDLIDDANYLMHRGAR